MSLVTSADGSGMDAARPSDASVEQSLRALLANNPTASIAAIGLDSLFCPVPEDLLAAGHRVVEARWSMDLVADDDRMAMVMLWERSREAGAAHAALSLVDGSRGTFHLFDTQATRGCSILVLVPGADVTIPDAGGAAAPAITPRHATAVRDERGSFVDPDEAVCRLLRTTPEEIATLSPLDFIHPEDQRRAIENWIDTVSAKGGSRRYRARHWCGDGIWRWMEFTNHIRSLDGGAFDIVSEMVDISEEMAMHEALRAREEFLRRLTSSLPVAVGQIDREGTFEFTNERLSFLLGTEDTATSEDLLAIVAPEQRHVLREALALAFTEGEDLDLELRTTPLGAATARVHRLGISTLRDGDLVVGALLSLTDVTESADLREALRRRATYDDLTGLHNRASIMTLLANALGSSREAGTGTAVVFVDLDGFKGINDEHGHAVGDDVLVHVGRRLRAAVRRQDLVGRIGGDEFLVVCPDVSEPSTALDVAERVARTMAEDLPVAGSVLRSRASIGVAWAADHQTTPEALIRAADAAMYESKRSGAGRPVLAGLVV
jgi:diguanylate cyclase (GGDEF)-like protein/PAS domain S-box-containing protein